MRFRCRKTGNSSRDNNGNEALYVTFNWNTDKNIWDYEFKTYYEHDEKGNDTLTLIHSWDKFKSIWDDGLLEANAYFTNGTRKSSVMYNWNNDHRCWNPVTCSLYPINGLEKKFRWDNKTLMWIKQ